MPVKRNKLKFRSYSSSSSIESSSEAQDESHSTLQKFESDRMRNKNSSSRKDGTPSSSIFDAKGGLKTIKGGQDLNSKYREIQRKSYAKGSGAKCECPNKKVSADTIHCPLRRYRSTVPLKDSLPETVEKLNQRIQMFAKEQSSPHDICEIGGMSEKINEIKPIMSQTTYGVRESESRQVLEERKSSQARISSSGMKSSRPSENGLKNVYASSNTQKKSKYATSMPLSTLCKTLPNKKYIVATPAKELTAGSSEQRKLPPERRSSTLKNSKSKYCLIKIEESDEDHVESKPKILDQNEKTRNLKESGPENMNIYHKRSSNTDSIGKRGSETIYERSSKKATRQPTERSSRDRVSKRNSFGRKKSSDADESVNLPKSYKVLGTCLDRARNKYENPSMEQTNRRSSRYSSFSRKSSSTVANRTSHPTMNGEAEILFFKQRDSQMLGNGKRDSKMVVNSQRDRQILGNGQRDSQMVVNSQRDDQILANSRRDSQMVVNNQGDSKSRIENKEIEKNDGYIETKKKPAASLKIPSQTIVPPLEKSAGASTQPVVGWITRILFLCVGFCLALIIYVCVYYDSIFHSVAKNPVNKPKTKLYNKVQDLTY